MLYDYCYSSSDDEVFVRGHDTKREYQSPPPIMIDGYPREFIHSTSIRGNSGIFPSPGITPSPRRDQNAVIFSVTFCGKIFGEIGLFEPDLSILDWKGFKSYIFSSLNLETSEEFVFTYMGENGEKVTISSQEDYETALRLARNRANDDVKFDLNIARFSSFPVLRSFMSSGMKRVNYSSARSHSSSVAQVKKNVTTSTSFLSFENILAPDEETKLLSEEDSLVPSDHERRTFGQLLLDMEKSTEKPLQKADIAFIALDESPSERSSPDFEMIPHHGEPVQEAPQKLRSLLQGHPLPVKVTVYASERSHTPLFCLEKEQSDESDPGIGQSLQYGSVFSSNQSVKESSQKAPLWFSNYMEKFKEELSTMVSSQIHEELEGLMGRINTQEVEGRIEGILGNYASVVQSKVVCCCKDTSGCTNKKQKRQGTNDNMKNATASCSKIRREQVQGSDRFGYSRANNRMINFEQPISTTSGNQLLEQREKVMARIKSLREFHRPKTERYLKDGSNANQREMSPSTTSNETDLNLKARDHDQASNSAPRPLLRFLPETADDNGATYLNKGLSSYFFYDASYPDGCEVPPNHTFIKKWIVYNDGSVPWENDVILAYLTRKGKIRPAFGKAHVPPLKPNESGVVSMLLQVLEREGVYSSEWSFYHKKQKKFFGDVIWCKVKVVKFCENPAMSGPAQLPRRGSLPNDAQQSHTDLQSQVNPKQSVTEENLMNGQTTSEEDIPTMTLDPAVVDDQKFLYNGTDESDSDTGSSSGESDVSSFEESGDDRDLNEIVFLYRDNNRFTKVKPSHRSESESAQDEQEEDEEPVDPDYFDDDEFLRDQKSDDDAQNDDDVTASIGDSVVEGACLKQSPELETPMEMPKLKKEVSDLHEAFQQRVQVKLDFEALPKSIQRPSASHPKPSDSSGKITFDENLFVTQPGKLKPLSPRPYPDTDEESSISDMLGEKREGSDSTVNLRSEQDLISLSSCSSFSDLATGDEGDDKATIATPVSETAEETSTTDKCSQASRPGSPEMSAFHCSPEDSTRHPMPSSSSFEPK